MIDLKSIGGSMSRIKFQEGSVRVVNGHWVGEWREYVPGQKKPRHRQEILGPAKLTKTEAKKKLRKEMAAPPPATGGDMTLAAFIESAYLPVALRRWAKNSRNCIRGTIKHHIAEQLGSLKLSEINKNRLDMHLIDRADSGCGRELLKRIHWMLYAIFDEALENDFILKNPARKLELPKLPEEAPLRPLTLTEASKLLGSVSGRDRLWFRILLLCGLRLGELLALRRDDVLPGTLRVDEGMVDGRPGPTKTRTIRFVPLAASLEKELGWWLDTMPDQSPRAFLWLNTEGRPYYRQTATRAVLEPAIEASGITDLDFRMCRRTFGTLTEGDIADVQAILGHTTPATTLKHYKQAIPERQRAAVEALEKRICAAN